MLDYQISNKNFLDIKYRNLPLLNDQWAAQLCHDTKLTPDSTYTRFIEALLVTEPNSHFELLFNLYLRSRSLWQIFIEYSNISKP